MSARRAEKTSDNIALSLLKAVSEAGSVFPPLQSAARDALRIIQVVKSFNSNTDDWRSLGTYVQEAVTSVIGLMARLETPDGDTRQHLESLHRVISEIAKEIEDERGLSWYERMQRFWHDPDTILNIRTRVDEVLRLFQLNVSATTSIDVKRTLDAIQENSRALSNIDRGLSSAARNATLDRLQSVNGASWDKSRACLENTRVDLIESICSWIKDAGSDKTIMLLTAVVGAGKSAVAHTIARTCAEEKHLAASFSFDREIEGRNTPDVLFTTIAANLARMDQRIADRIMTAIEEDGSLPSAPISNQFEGLIIEPCRGISFTQPLVIVIDALDEAWNDRLLDIFRDKATNLPPMFRIFLTSRMRPELGSLCDASHVRTVELNIQDMTNMSDMAVFVPYKLRVLAKDMSLGVDWPGDTLSAKLTEKAGGLFQWIATVCEYLRQYDDPTAELESLLSSTDPATNTAEEKMDKLYATILDSYNWKDKVFVESYHRVMGMAIASQTPMSVSAMEELYERVPLASERTLHRLSPLLTGMNKTGHASQPVRLIHQSLRDFLVIRSEHSPQFARFRVSEGVHNQELSLLCLRTLNKRLKEDMPAVGYLTNNREKWPGVPKIDRYAISEALWYACCFWPDHICNTSAWDHIPSELLEFMGLHDPSIGFYA
ncbi:hypothetical protein RhiLY_00355 [Ceratobasidium sp. AG-Ba]|nr:hypothetical protein RhiLY_00355 [Ceratobasidium sp. AG-Ba]